MDTGIIEALIKKGVRIPVPETVFVDGDVDIERISGDGVVLYPGCRISGGATVISGHVRLGTGGPVSLNDCRVGPRAEIASGVFEKSVLLGENRIGPNAHFREGTILEEGAGAAHCVGLKQTILFPFVTLGSLINFCDCLMAGGTGPRDHSEVGSSYIHFNFTPNQDKATPSLIGDVPRGVMLNQPPIFLGGQGGMVGPCRVEYGTVAASGTILRKDVTDPGRILFEAPRRSFSAPNTPGLYRNIRKIVANNLHYLGNLKALEAWYTHFRPLTVAGPLAQHLLDGLRQTLSAAIEERIARISQFVGKLPESIGIYRSVMGESASERLVAEKTELVDRWPEVAAVLQKPASAFESPPLRDRFLEAAGEGTEAENGYLAAVRGLSAPARESGIAWLAAVVSAVREESWAHLRLFPPKTEKDPPGPGGRK